MSVRRRVGGVAALVALCAVQACTANQTDTGHAVPAEVTSPAATTPSAGEPSPTPTPTPSEPTPSEEAGYPDRMTDEGDFSIQNAEGYTSDYTVRVPPPNVGADPENSPPGKTKVSWYALLEGMVTNTTADRNNAAYALLTPVGLYKSSSAACAEANYPAEELQNGNGVELGYCMVAYAPAYVPDEPSRALEPDESRKLVGGASTNTDVFELDDYPEADADRLITSLSTPEGVAADVSVTGVPGSEDFNDPFTGDSKGCEVFTSSQGVDVGHWLFIPDADFFDALC